MNACRWQGIKEKEVPGNRAARSFQPWRASGVRRATLPWTDVRACLLPSFPHWRSMIDYTSFTYLQTAMQYNSKAFHNILYSYNTNLNSASFILFVACQHPHVKMLFLHLLATPRQVMLQPLAYCNSIAGTNQFATTSHNSQPN